MRIRDAPRKAAYKRGKAMATDAQAVSQPKLGWRFGVGGALVIGGYLVLGIIPVIATSDLPVGAKSVFTGFIAVTPLLTKIAAIVVMGKPGFNYFIQLVLKV